MQLKEGTTLRGGKYRIEQVLGRGSFGITYLAVTDVEMKGPLGSMVVTVNVAIKEFFMSEFNSRDDDGNTVTGSNSSLVMDYRRKFRREAENLGRLNHPNIVKVLEVFDENNTTYYAMEYIDGGSLDDQIKRRGHLTEKEALHITKDLCDALSYMHHQNMLHLDLKPKNIMLRQRDCHVFLIDFGLSKQYTANGEPESSTTIGLGTPGYAPIEQANYKQDGTFPATIDIYALGATLYKMLTGNTPPHASDIYNEGMPARPNYVSAKVWHMVECAMQLRKVDRPQSVDEFLKILDAPYADDEATQISRYEDEATEVVGKAVEDIPHIEPKRKNGRWWMWIAGCIIVVAVAVIAVIAGISSNEGQEFTPTMSEVMLGDNDVLTQLNNDMVYVAGGMFTMGATSEQGSDADGDEKPTHQVTLSSFYICKHEVTQEEWEAVMDSNPSYWEGKRLPVEKVSWNDCQEFIEKLNQITGQHYRLPTEAEWEYAARGGNKSQGYKYSGSNSIGEVAWWSGNSGSKTHEVMQKQPNELGLYDMSGNIDEWCQDRYGGYSSSAQTNPTGPASGSYRVSRGSSWGYYTATHCRVTDRNFGPPSYASNNNGLRLAL